MIGILNCFILKLTFDTSSGSLLWPDNTIDCWNLKIFDFDGLMTDVDVTDIKFLVD